MGSKWGQNGAPEGPRRGLQRGPRTPKSDQIWVKIGSFWSKRGFWHHFAMKDCFNRLCSEFGQNRAKSGQIGPRRPKSGPGWGPAGRGQNGVKMGSKWGPGRSRNRVQNGVENGVKNGSKKRQKRGPFFVHFLGPRNHVPPCSRKNRLPR
jgi:hypothetical protein